MSTSSSFRRAGKNPDRAVRVFGVTADRGFGHILTANETTIGAHEATVSARARQQHTATNSGASQSYSV